MSALSQILPVADETVFTEAKFWLLIAFSLVVPGAIYGFMMAKRAMSRRAMLLLGLTLVMIAGIDVYLLQSLATLAKQTPSLVDDALFASEVSLALYLLPALFGGIGINVVSHVLIHHLDQAVRAFRREHPDG